MTTPLLVILALGAVLGLRTNVLGLVIGGMLASTAVFAAVIYHGEGLPFFVQLAAFALTPLQAGWFIGVAIAAAWTSIPTTVHQFRVMVR